MRAPDCYGNGVVILLKGKENGREERRREKGSLVNGGVATGVFSNGKE